MSATRGLTKFYGSFFWKCGEVAICPYLLMLDAFMDSNPRQEDLILGVTACIIFSTVVPVLPAITSLTFAIASCAASMALASMFVTYPFAIFADAVQTICSDNSRYAY